MHDRHLATVVAPSSPHAVFKQPVRHPVAELLGECFGLSALESSGFVGVEPVAPATAHATSILFLTASAHGSVVQKPHVVQ